MKDIPTSDEITNAVVSVYQTTAEKCGAAILGALVPHMYEPERAIWNVPDYEAEELCRFVNQFKGYLKGEREAPARTRLQILVYCHIMEAETFPAVIWNLLRLLSGEHPQWSFETPTGEACAFPEKRFEEIRRVSTLVAQPIGPVLCRLWHRKLRNAFLHAQYSTFTNGNFSGTKNISPLTSGAVRPSDRRDSSGENPTYYTADEIERLFQASLDYLDAVTKRFREAIRPFQNGEFHDFPTFPIRWDAEIGWWSPRPE
jgi:hypothetical protein